MYPEDKDTLTLRVNKTIYSLSLETMDIKSTIKKYL